MARKTSEPVGGVVQGCVRARWGRITSPSYDGINASSPGCDGIDASLPGYDGISTPLEL